MLIIDNNNNNLISGNGIIFRNKYNNKKRIKLNI